MNVVTRLGGLTVDLTLTLVLTLVLGHSEAAAAPSGATPRVIAAWNFNQTTPTNAPQASTGQGTAAALGGITVSLAAGTGSSDPATSADLAWNAAGFPPQGKNPRTAGVEFRTSTAGWTDLTLRFDLRPSNTSSRHLAVLVSADGVSFTSAAMLTLVSGGAFTNGLTVALPAALGVEDSPGFTVRLVSDFDPASGTTYAAISGNYSVAGTWRFDQVAILGQPKPGTDPLPTTPPRIVFTNILTQLRRPGDLATNTAPDLALLPGDRVELHVHVDDPAGHPFEVAWDSAGESANWTPAEDDGTTPDRRHLVFRYEARTADVGRRLEPRLLAWNRGVTNAFTWRIHLPDAAQRNVVLTEFLANPAANPGQPLFNPLGRPTPTDRPTVYDEFLELVNFGDQPVDLTRWQIHDAASVRLVFPPSTVLAPGQALLVYGGPGNDSLAAVDPEVVVLAASEGISGLSLNNDGDTIALYDAATNLVWRVVYVGQQLSTAGSLARNPDRDGVFVALGGQGLSAVTPGRSFDDAPFISSPLEPDGAGVRITLDGSFSDGFELSWPAETGAHYRIWSSESLAEAFTPLEVDVVAEEGIVRYPVSPSTTETTRFFRVSRP